MNNTEQKFGGNRKNKDERHYYFIYMHINKINNKKYIGITYQNPPEKRWKRGSTYRKTSNPHFYYAIQKYGWDSFEHVILEEGYFTVKEAGEKEDYYINFYDTCNQDKGYNMAPGGYKGLAPNALPAAIKWMKEHPEFGLACASNMHKWQKEHPKEMEEMLKNNIAKASEARKKKVVCVETEEIFESATEASKNITNCSQSKITMCCQGQRKTAGGYHWIYFEEYLKIDSIEGYLSEINKKNHRPHNRRVLCVETQEIFESVTQAANIKKLSLYSIAECCRNKKENNYTCGGYHWRYIDE